MSSDSERDRSTDALLRAARPGLPAGDVASCLDAETLAAWSEQRLPEAQAARVEAHLSGCHRCQQLLAAFVRTEPVAAAGVPFWQRWPRRWLVPAGAVAAAAVIFAIVARETTAPPVQMARQEAASGPAIGAQESFTPPASRTLDDRAATSSADAPRVGAAPRQTALSPELGAGRAAPAPDALSRRDEAPSRQVTSVLGPGAQQKPVSPSTAGDAAGSARRGSASGIASLPGVFGGLAAPPPPPPTNVTPRAGPTEAPAEGKPAAPPPTSEVRTVTEAEAARTGSTKLDSVQVTNLPLNEYRNYQALVVLTPGEAPETAASKDQAANALADAVVVEIVSADAPALTRTGGRGGAGRGPAAATQAAEAASAAARLPATIPARWRILANGRVERSINAGATWHPVAIDAPVALTAGSSPSDLVCWMIGPAGVVVRSTDGERFTRLPFPEPATLASIVAVNDRAATVRTADGRTYVTADGGVSWVLR